MYGHRPTRTDTDTKKLKDQGTRLKSWEARKIEVVRLRSCEDEKYLNSELGMQNAQVTKDDGRWAKDAGRRKSEIRGQQLQIKSAKDLKVYQKAYALANA